MIPDNTIGSDTSKKIVFEWIFTIVIHKLSPLNKVYIYISIKYEIKKISGYEYLNLNFKE